MEEAEAKKKIAELESKLQKVTTNSEAQQILSRMETLDKKIEEMNGKEDKDEKKGETDEECCHDCGGDLEEIRQGVFKCVLCGELYNLEE